jgi:ABC-2 type transport system ATP-binding protein
VTVPITHLKQVFTQIIFALSLVGISIFAIPSAMAQSTPTQLQIPGAGVNLDASIYYPQKTPAPLILIAHGFGGDKNSVASDAQYLQQRGFVVVAWSARGFGASTGQIFMDAPDKEVADASKIIDFMSNDAKVKKGSNSQPIVGVVGSSYGGALALGLAESDSRVGAVVSDITWAHLAQALFPQSASPAPIAGPFKKVWAGTFFSLSTLRNSYLGQCGNFADAWCTAFQNAVNNSIAGKQPSASDLELLNNSSPARTGQQIAAPTLLMQGEDDSLFPLSESLSNISALFPSNDNLSLIWHSGGHDGGNPEQTRLIQATGDWFDKYLNHRNIYFPKFEVTDNRGTISVTDSTPVSTVLKSDHLPSQASFHQIALSGTLGAFFSPIGGEPAAVSSLPGVGSVSSLASGLISSLGGGAGSAFGVSGLSSALLPGQSTQLTSAALAKPVTIIGSSQIKVRVTSTAKNATLFFSLLAQAKNGALRQPGGVVAPVYLDNIPSVGSDVEITLPAVYLKLAAGEKIVLGVSATDQGYQLPSDGRFYTVTPLSNLSYPTLDLTPLQSSTQLIVWPIAAGIVLILAIVYLVVRRRRVDATPTVSAENIIEITNLSKVYSDGYKAVNNLSFSVGRGQVLGLLGPNGAGKTTTLRMLMGLILPTEGRISLNGQSVFPGSPALSQLGSFVEGPGFLPHLTGRENLEIYWKSIGRDDDPAFDEVIAITKLGSALDKKVRSYSQGMRQRLSIAQAMLGLPDILVLDEPTNGLDPQQIAEMRHVLKEYATNGRTVIISSHLLAEIQQTCTHVVLMHRGSLLATGQMQEILKDSDSLEEIFLEIIGDDLIIGSEKP